MAHGRARRGREGREREIRAHRNKRRLALRGRLALRRVRARQLGVARAVRRSSVTAGLLRRGSPPLLGDERWNYLAHFVGQPSQTRQQLGLDLLGVEQ